MKKKVVFYYLTGDVHVRHLSILQHQLPEYVFVPLLHPEVVKLDADLKKKAHLVNKKGYFSESMWKVKPSLVIMRHALPTSWRLQLVWGAKKRQVPILAIEEVNQLTLNGTRINNYILPVDVLMLPSEHEKQLFLKLGYEKERLMVIGWPFFDEMLVKNNYMDNGEKVALVTIGVLRKNHPAMMETRDETKQLLKLVADGLPENYLIRVKPHPAESERGFRAMIKETRITRNCEILDPKVSFYAELNKSDLLISRGFSQTVLEAMALSKQVAVVPLGLPNVFERHVPQLVVNNSAQLRRLVEKYREKEVDYQLFLKRHVPTMGRKSLDTLLKTVTKLADKRKIRAWSQNDYQDLIVASFHNDNNNLIDESWLKIKSGLKKREWITLLAEGSWNAEVFKKLVKVKNRVTRMMVLGLMLKAIEDGQIKFEKWMKKEFDGFDVDMLPFYFFKARRRLIKLYWNNFYWKKLFRLMKQSMAVAGREDLVYLIKRVGRAK